MNTIKGQKLISVSASADEIYKVEYETGHTLNILNHTDDVITVSDKEDYYDDGISANCLKIPAKSYYNGFKNSKSSTFISSLADGIVTVVRTA